MGFSLQRVIVNVFYAGKLPVVLLSFINSPGGARPRQGGEGRQLSTARSSFPLKLQPCTATRPSSAIPWWPVCKTCKTLQAGPASGPRKPCRVLLLGQLLLLLQGLLQTSQCWSPTILQEVMPGHSSPHCKVQNAGHCPVDKAQS